MSKERNTQTTRRLLLLGISAFLLVLAARFMISYLKSDGFSGISILIPLFLIGIVIFGLSTSVCFSLWVYEDCKKRNDDTVLWPIIVFVTTPYIGLIIYLLRRSEIMRICPNCGHRISIKAKYCEECGTYIETEREVTDLKRTHHLNFIVAGIICIVLMLGCLTGFIVSAANGKNINTSIASDKKIWNSGTIFMSYETHLNDIWKLTFNSASKGFVKQTNMTISNPENDFLYADISCAVVPEGSSLMLWLVQGDTAESIDVTNLTDPLEYPLSEFKRGKIHVRLQINGVKKVVSEVYIK